MTETSKITFFLFGRVYEAHTQKGKLRVKVFHCISENMTAWEIAEELLNHPTYFSVDEYNYMLMP